jgi:hypothetical protein
MGLPRSFPLLMLSALFFHAPLYAQALVPQPPCGTDPVPSWPAVDQAAASKLWSRADFGRDWKPPACTGWTATGFTTLVTTVARSRFPADSSDSDAVLRRIGAISDRAGTRYWSTTHQKWETLITDAYALTGPQSGARRANFTADEVKAGKSLYFQQTDNLTGKGVYRLNIFEASADRIVFEVENVSTMKYLFVPVFSPGEVQSVYFLDREPENVWRYYSILRTGLHASGLVTANDSSAINRAVAFYRRFVGIPTDQEPPAAR